MQDVERYNKSYFYSFAVSFKNAVPQLARSGYLFSCLITCANGYKIGHKKRINKVLLTVRRYTALMQFWHGGQLINNMLNN